ncbi:helix-turn-helix transcriptional regulator [Streptomyces sp. P38-E01]|uniref:Helix-turn-helix transcriptional regulator n=1 Tax=Streptomyces tardus TaxID=2780544 RepID=A0A949JNY5_9ACTN|nr:helix-turn-helix transcriptional regulator [Streptomyces tardus]MBU7597595.1 helix-turn-helix transcriptional regulator [Streptomyces tardus]
MSAPDEASAQPTAAADAAEPVVRGLTPYAENLYRELLHAPHPAHTDRVAPPNVPSVHGEGRSAGQRRDAVAELAELGLVRLDEHGTPRPLPPRLALESWAAQRELEAVRARESADLLAQLYSAHTGAGARYAEVLEDVDEVVRVFAHMQDQARGLIRGFDRGSVLAPEEIGPNPWQLACMQRGVRYHVVYESDFLQTDVGLRSLQVAVKAGEVARVFPGVPMKLAIADDDRALISVPRPESGDIMALLVHSSMLLDALIDLFEAFWRLAVPISASVGRSGGTVGTEPTPTTQRLLALLSAGSTDEAIARELEISERTVHRRVRRLQELLGARTRFQLGVQAARRGWL